jgi:hypothetical protein
MGWLRRKNLNNTAAANTIPMPPVGGNTTVHHHGTNWPMIIITGVLCALFSLPVLWLFLVYLFRQLGYNQPQQVAAWWILAIPIFLIAVWAVGWLLDRILSEVREIIVEVQRETTRRVEVQLLAAQTSIDSGRMNEADYEFARVILAVMMIAYEWQKVNGRSDFPGRWRPWSMRSAKETAKGIGIKLTDTQANAVSLWLHNHGIITSADSGQIEKNYPDLSNVRALLEKEFGKPIVVVSPTLRDNRGFEHI